MPNIVANLSALEGQLRADLSNLSEMEDSYPGLRQPGWPDWQTLMDQVMASWRKVSAAIQNAGGVLTELWPVGESVFNEESANAIRYDSIIAQAVRHVTEPVALAVALGNAEEGQVPRDVPSQSAAFVSGGKAKLWSVVDSLGNFFDFSTWSTLKWIVAGTVLVLGVGGVFGVSAYMGKKGELK